MAKEEPDSLGEDVFDKLNEIPVVEEARLLGVQGFVVRGNTLSLFSIHTMTFIADGTMVLPPAYTRDCVSMCHEFVLSCVSLLIRIPMDEARSDAVRHPQKFAALEIVFLKEFCLTRASRHDVARRNCACIADASAAGSGCGICL